MKRILYTTSTVNRYIVSFQIYCMPRSDDQAMDPVGGEWLGADARAHLELPATVGAVRPPPRGPLLALCRKGTTPFLVAAVTPRGSPMLLCWRRAVEARRRKLTREACTCPQFARLAPPAPLADGDVASEIDVDGFK